jgi:hypothetical protein
MGMYYNPSIVTNDLVCLLDSQNPKSWSQNVYPYPLDIGSYITSGNQQTITRDTSETSPAGGVPMKIVTSGTSSYTSSYNNSYWNIAPSVSGDTWNVSFWVKGSSNFEARFILFDANSSGNYISAPTQSYNVTTEWTRISLSRTLSGTGTAFIQFRFDIYVSGVTAWFDGLQIERGSSATEFNPKTNTNGTSWYDISGNENHFTLFNSPTFSSGSISFDGSTQYGRSTNTLDLTPYSYVVVESLIKSNTTSTGGIIYEHSNNWNTNAGGFGLAIHSNGSIFYLNGFHTNYNSNGVARNYEENINDNWANHVNIFGTVPDSTGRLTYVNGKLSPFTSLNGYATSTSTTISTTRNDYFYLASRGGTTGFTDGRISSIKIYGSKLSENQIIRNFAALRGRIES